jgi:hypothetical protein
MAREHILSACAAWGAKMKNYSIIRIGNEYVVRAGEKSVIKVSSRRRAAQLVTDAAELLDSQIAPADSASMPSITHL